MVKLVIVLSIIFVSEARSEQCNRSIIFVLENLIGCFVSLIHAAFIGVATETITSYVQFFSTLVFELD